MQNFERMDQYNLAELEELLVNDGMEFDLIKLNEFVKTDGSYGFIYRLDNKPIGLAYGCRLSTPDGLKELYLHSIDILPDYQNNGHGTQFVRNILQFAKDNGFCKLFLCTSECLKNACRVYEKCGGKRECKDEIVYSYDLGE